MSRWSSEDSDYKNQKRFNDSTEEVLFSLEKKKLKI